jgi:alpha,alpha-trehalose phosphorylase
MLGNKFTKEEKKRNYDYYEKITTHDSSLSTCIFSIVASEIGYYKKAYNYFMNTARMDLDDYHGNTKHGIHAANMAGTWMCLVHGFAGMRIYDNTLSFNPYLPESWEEYSFKITYKGRLIGVTVKRHETSYELLEGEALEMVHCGQKIFLEARQIFSNVI